MNALQNKKVESGNKSIPDMCLALHMHNTGASDPLPTKEYGEYFHFLENKLENWKPTALPSSKYFDDSVKELVAATIYECNREQDG